MNKREAHHPVSPSENTLERIIDQELDTFRQHLRQQLRANSAESSGETGKDRFRFKKKHRELPYLPPTRLEFPPPPDSSWSQTKDYPSSAHLWTTKPGRRQHEWTGWTLVPFATFTFLSMIMLIGFLSGPSGSTDPTSESAAGSSLPDEVPIFPEADPIAAEAIALAFLQSSSVNELLGLIHDGKRLAPMVRRYYEGNSLPGGHSGEITLIQSGSTRDEAVVVFKKEGSEAATLGVIDQGSGYKVDWEAFVNYSDLSWEQFHEKKPTHPVTMRVALNWSQHYAVGFENPGQWISFAMSDTAGEPVGHAYAFRESPLSRDLLHHLPHEDGVFLAIVKIAYPDDTQATGAELIELVRPGWLAFGKS